MIINDNNDDDSEKDNYNYNDNDNNGTDNECKLFADILFHESLTITI